MRLAAWPPKGCFSVSLATSRAVCMSPDLPSRVFLVCTRWMSMPRLLSRYESTVRSFSRSSRAILSSSFLLLQRSSLTYQLRSLGWMHQIAKDCSHKRCSQK